MPGVAASWRNSLEGFGTSYPRSLIFTNPHFRGFIKCAPRHIYMRMKFRLAALLLIIFGAIARAEEFPRYNTELDIPYCKVDGKTLTLNAFLPVDATNPVPAMVDIHGGWWFAG